jgi:hypothetical protein
MWTEHQGYGAEGKYFLDVVVFVVVVAINLSEKKMGL